jgi:hypothetical protein
MPKTVATMNANVGFPPALPLLSAVAGSVDGFIGIVLVLLGQAAISFRYIFLVEYRIGNNIFFASPITEIVQSATIAAEGEIAIVLGIRGPFANGTFVFHGLRKVLSHRLQVRQREK